MNVSVARRSPIFLKIDVHNSRNVRPLALIPSFLGEMGDFSKMLVSSVS